MGLIWAEKAYMGSMWDPNGINAQILTIWVPYIHVCWGSCRPEGLSLPLK